MARTTAHDALAGGDGQQAALDDALQRPGRRREADGRAQPHPVRVPAPELPVRNRVWAQDVAVAVDVLRARLNELSLRGRQPVPPDRQAVIDGVALLLEQARNAAFRVDPQPTRFGNWWRGTLIEAAYTNLHAAEAAITALYDQDLLDAEVPDAVARVEAGLHRDDPRRAAAHQLPVLPRDDRRRVAVRKAVEVGYAAVDRQHARIRSFRNVVLVTTALIAVLLVVFCVVVTLNPTAVPLCFDAPAGQPKPCPAGEGEPHHLDVLVVALLGLLGGSLAAAVSVRTLRGTSIPYDVPVALALLKVPAGALTALGALIVVRGDFVPGFSDLDTQDQVLAYALVFGYAQQLLTGMVDARAHDLLDGVPSKDPAVPRTPVETAHPEPPAQRTAPVELLDDEAVVRTRPRATPNGRAGRSPTARRPG